MLRKDGRVKFYTVQYLSTVSNQWTELKLENFIGVSQKDAYNPLEEPYRSFTLSGKCWQTIGERGCYNKKVAIRLLKLLNAKYTKISFRVIHVEMWQETQQVYPHQHYPIPIPRR